MRPLSCIITLFLLGPIALIMCEAQSQSDGSIKADGQLKPDGWPKSFVTSNGTTINLYSPQILSYSDNVVQSRSVISVQDDPGNDPVFGVAWMTAKVIRDGSGQNLQIQSVRVDRLRIPDDENNDDNNYISAAMEMYLPVVVK